MRNAHSSLWWQHPDAFLYAWDFAAGQARFLPLDREILNRSSFLDQRLSAAPSEVSLVSIGEVLNNLPTPPSRPPAFIFHTAFCCSTLLARSLDLPGRTLVLREPATLLQLADLKRGLGANTTHTVPALLKPTVDLLVRPFTSGERALIKPTNLVNNLIPDIVAAYPDARVLILHDDLEAFLISVLKRPHESEQGIISFLQRLVRDDPARSFPPEVLGVTGLPQRAALAWALQMHGLATWLETRPGNIRTLAAPRLLAAPAETMGAISDWLDLDMDKRTLQSVAEGPVWKRHAKHPDHDYTPRRRDEEQALARRVLAEPMHRGLDWVARVPGLIPPKLPAEIRLVP